MPVRTFNWDNLQQNDVVSATVLLATVVGTDSTRGSSNNSGGTHISGNSWTASIGCHCWQQFCSEQFTAAARRFVRFLRAIVIENFCVIAIGMKGGIWVVWRIYKRGIPVYLYVNELCHVLYIYIQQIRIMSNCCVLCFLSFHLPLGHGMLAWVLIMVCWCGMDSWFQAALL